MDKRTANRIARKIEQRNVLYDQDHEDKVRRAWVFYDSLEDMPPDERNACIVREAWSKVSDNNLAYYRMNYGSALKTNTHVLYTRALNSLYEMKRGAGLAVDLWEIRDHARIVSHTLLEQRKKEIGPLNFATEVTDEVIRMIERLSEKDGTNEACFIAGYIEWLAFNLARDV